MTHSTWSWAWRPIDFETPDQAALLATAPGRLSVPVLAAMALLSAPLSAWLSLSSPALAVLPMALAGALGFAFRGSDSLEAGPDGITLVRATPWSTEKQHLDWDSVAAQGVYLAPAAKLASDKGTHLWIRPVRPPIGPEPEALVYAEGGNVEKLQALSERLVAVGTQAGAKHLTAG